MLYIHPDLTNDTNSLPACWRPEWVQPYESLWSLLAKFAYLNAANISDVKDCFVGEFVRAELPGRYWHSSLNGFSILDRRKLCTLMEMEETTLIQATSLAYLAHNEVAVLASEQLRYCTLCLATGFHSPLHQMLFLSECPVHKLPLITECSHCGRSLRRYALNFLHSKTFTGCDSCPDSRHRFRDFKQELAKQTSEGRELEEVAEIMLKRMSLDMVSAHVLEQAGLRRPGKWQARRLKKLTDYWRDIFSVRVPASNVPQSYSARYVRVHSAPSERLRKDSTGYGDFSRDVAKEMIAIYKSIARNLVNRELRSHRTCIAEVGQHVAWVDDRRSKKGKLCIAANAFLLWRMVWEGVSHPAMLFGARKRASFPQRYLKWRSPDRSRAIPKSAIRRIFALECLGVFHECLLLAKFFSRRRSYSFCRQLIEGTRKPYWTIELSQEDDAIVHWWPRSRTAALNAIRRSLCAYRPPSGL